MSVVQVNDEEGESLGWVRIGDTKQEALERLCLSGRLFDKDDVGLLNDERITAEGGPYVLRAHRHQQTDSSKHSLTAPPTKKLKTQSQQKGASGFTATNCNIASGLGTTPYGHRLVPKSVKEAFWDGKVEETPSPLFEELKNVLQKNRISGPMSLVVVHETDGRGQYGYTVQAMFLDGIAKSTPFARKMTTERPPFRDGLEAPTRRNLGDLGLSAGITSSASYMDGYLHADSNIHKGVPTSVFEAKNDCTAPKQGNLEAVAHATNVAMGLVTRGISPEDTVVPIFSSNGRLVEVLAVYFLPRSTFPVVCFLTPILDLFDESGLNCAATALSKMLAHCNNITKRLSALQESQQLEAETIMELNLLVYFVKPLSNFCSILGQDRLDESIARVFQLTSTLHGCSYACPPLAYRLRDTTNVGAESVSFTEDVLVFERLVGFHIGFPSDVAERTKVFIAMKAAVKKFHSHGLVHLDLYLSNIMWKKKNDEDAYDACIVDFDSVHQNEAKLSTTVLERLQLQGFDPVPSRAAYYLDDLYLEVLEQNLDAAELAYQDDQRIAKSMMDEFFMAKLAQHISQRGVGQDC